MATQQKIVPKTIVVELSQIPTMLRIGSIQLVTLLSFVFIFFISSTLLEGIGGLVFVILIFMIVATNLFLSTLFYIDWKTKFYEIRPSAIVEKRGVLFRREEIYSCSNIEEIILRQGIIERIFGFGTIRMYDPSLRQSIYLKNIKSPYRYQEILSKRFQNSDSSGSSRVILGQGL